MLVIDTLTCLHIAYYLLRIRLCKLLVALFAVPALRPLYADSLQPSLADSS